MYEKTSRKRNYLGHQTYYIMNANQLYTTQHRMQRFFRIDGHDFEYRNNEWKKVPLNSLDIYLDIVAQKCENLSLFSYGRMALELFLEQEGKMTIL